MHQHQSEMYHAIPNLSSFSHSPPVLYPPFVFSSNYLCPAHIHRCNTSRSIMSKADAEGHSAEQLTAIKAEEPPHVHERYNDRSAGFRIISSDNVAFHVRRCYVEAGRCAR
jgi:hypothetical protein